MLTILMVIFFNVVSGQKKTDNEFVLDETIINILCYQKYTDAYNYLKTKLAENNQNGQYVFWQAQTELEDNEITKNNNPEIILKIQNYLKDALAKNPNDPWILLGLANLDVLNGKEFSAAQQTYDQIFTSTLITKGKNKGLPQIALVYGLGRFYSKISRSIGNRNYVVDKLKAESNFEPKNPWILNVLAQNYIKLNSDNGGEAVSALREASNLDKKQIEPIYQLAKIYGTQDNDDLVNQYYQQCNQIDPKFAPIYYFVFDYYEEKDADKAKHALDKYLELADKSPNTDYVSAEYAYRTRDYKSSLEKSTQLENNYGLNRIPSLSLLLAYNYYNLKDYEKAKKYIEYYLDNNAEELVHQSAYDLAVNIFSNSPGSETKAAVLLDKAIQNENNIKVKLNLARKGIQIMENAKLYSLEYDWFLKLFAIQKNYSELDLYKIVELCNKGNYINQGLNWSKIYMTEHPEKINGPYFYKNFALKLDPDTSTGAALPYLDTLNAYYNANLTNDTSFVYKINDNINYHLKFAFKKFNSYSDQFYKDSNNIDSLESLYMVILNLDQEIFGCLDQMQSLFANSYLKDRITSYCTNTKTSIQKLSDDLLHKKDQIIKRLQKNAKKSG